MRSSFFKLGYGSYEAWIATLGTSPEQKFNPQTGKEDFTEQRRVGNYLTNWQPGEPWVPQQICLHFEARGRKRVKADRVFHGAVGPIISERAVNEMRPFIDKAGYALPLEVMNCNENYFLFWVPWVPESVDFKQSEKFPNGRTIKKYAFNEKLVAGLVVFRPHHRGAYNPAAQGDVLVNDEFRRAWISSNLSGIEFVDA